MRQNSIHTSKTGPSEPLWLEHYDDFSNPWNSHPIGMICIDLDGTLIRGGSPIQEEVLEKLVLIGKAGWIRVIATGRSPGSIHRIIPDIGRFPIDYIVFSSGAGIINCHQQNAVRVVNHSPAALTPVLNLLNEMQLDYMIHQAAPNNTRFSWFSHGKQNPDFNRRIKLYETECVALPDAPSNWSQPSSQIIVILPHVKATDHFNTLIKTLTSFSIVRTTSPLDGESIWAEIFPKIVSKGQTCRWLMSQFGMSLRTIAIGNDTNDLDLLQWADEGYVVMDATTELKKLFRIISSGDRHPVSHLIMNLLGTVML
ncbi:HAD family phosphatase [bacterium]|nr:HAD family phosphatase [candidate division CSSED10-310 bacterium]